MSTVPTPARSRIDPFLPLGKAMMLRFYLFLATIGSIDLESFPFCSLSAFFAAAITKTIVHYEEHKRDGYATTQNQVMCIPDIEYDQGKAKFLD
ncbi:MAG: hypothetical protein JXM70_07020 [Pirellulales bacterium]|nr:hypothetical protein [Pirellulales bacterium]